MSKDLCEAFLAYMKLIQLRNAWVRRKLNVYKIRTEDDKICVLSIYPRNGAGLSFPTYEIADEFIKTFNDLLEVAKPLL